MAPKKAKKKGKIGDDWDEEPAADDTASVATTSTTDQAHDGKKGPKKKAKGKKGKGKGGDWESDDDDDLPLKVQGDSDETSRGPQKKPAKGQAKPKAAAAAFALLQEEDEDDPEAAAEEEDADSDGGQANGKAPVGFSALDASDGEVSEAEEDTASGASPGKGNGLAAALIVAVKRHPNADKLKVCVVDAGSGTVEVVTNAANAKEGMTVVLAAAGSTTPGSGMKIEHAKVRGVDSHGMLCSAYDIGWVSEPDGVLVQLPAAFVPGAACPDDPPEGAIFGPLSKSKEKKKSKKDLEHSFAALSVEGEEPHAASEDEEDDGFGLPAGKSKKPKKKGKKAPPSFALLGDEEDADAAPEPGVEDDDDAFGPPASKKKGGKKAKSSAAPSFAALASEDGEEGDAGDAEQFDELDLPPKRSKKKDKTKGGAGAPASFAALASEEGEEGDAGDADQFDELDLPPKRSKKKDKTKGGVEELANGEAHGDPEGVDDEEDLEQLLASKSKKKSKKKDPADLAAAFAALGVDGDADEAGQADENGDLASLGKKKKKGKKKTDVDSLFAALEADADASAAAPEATPTGGDLEVKPEANGEVGGKKKKKKAVDTDIDALLAEIDGPKAPAPEPAAEGGEAKGKKKKKGGKAEKKEEDLDAILAELGMAPPEPQAAAAPAEATPAAAPAEDGAEADAAADEGEGEGKELTAAQKKKLKKKAKEKEKKKGGGAEGEEEGEEGAEAKKGKKPGKPQSAAVRRLQEELERKRIAEEERQRAEEERIRQEEEAERIREEEERIKAEEAERKKAEKRDRRAEMKRQGLILTGKAKKEAERLAAMREQILKNTAAEDAATAAALAAGDAPVKKKVVYDTRKKKPPPKKADDAAMPDTEVEEAKRKAEQQEAEEQEHKRAKEEEARLLKEQEEAALAAAAEAEAAQAGSSEEDDWEAMDLDSLKLPGHEEEEAKRKAEEAAAASKAAEEAAKKETAAKAAETAEESEEESEEEDESSDEGTSSDEDSSEEESTSYETDSEEDAAEERLRLAKEKREARLRAAQEAGSRDNLRSPICCILGHVDTGKTKILDNIRRTSVQEGEAGGITQQIGATYVPVDAIQKRTESLRKGRDFDLKLPGLLIIDTPGHESFSNLRSRGSGLCDIAILVVDLMHGLEPQTIESINLLKMRKTPFIVALNKVDRLFDWKAHTDAPIQDSLAGQKDYVRTEFEKRLKASILNLNEQGLNVALYWKNPDPRKYVNIVPTSAITGEGIPDMLQLLVKLTQSMMSERLMFISELQCTVLEVKVVEGHGTTIDVVLVNGVLREGDTIVICGLQGPIVTSIRSLLTPHPLKELRVRGQYDHHKEVKAAQGIKIAAHGLENAVAGTQLLVLGKDDDVNVLKEEVMEDMQDIFSSVDRSGEGVCVQASTLGSLEALLEFLKSPAVKIPVSAINIGPIHKKDIMRASVMLEKGRKKFCCILAFDVPVTREAAELADKLGVRIFTADIIYHLFDQFTAYIKQVKEDEKEDAKSDASFPCELTILPNCIFNTKDPIILGVEVKEGIARVGTPICIPSQGFMDLGKIASLELNKKAVDKAVKGDMVAMKIEATKAEESSRLYGRHFDFKDLLVSRISRKSIDVLKQHFRDDLSKDDWRLVVKLKKVFGIE